MLNWSRSNNQRRASLFQLVILQVLIFSEERGISDCFMQYGHLTTVVGGEAGGENLNHLRCPRERQHQDDAGKYHHRKCWDQDVGGQTFVLDDSRFMLAGSRSGIRESLKRQGLHSLPRSLWCMHRAFLYELEAKEKVFLFSPACSITGTWAEPGAGHLHLKLTIPCTI